VEDEAEAAGEDAQGRPRSADTRNGIAQHESVPHALAGSSACYESGAYDTYIRTDRTSWRTN
jgi:hypothetical protein